MVRCLPGVPVVLIRLLAGCTLDGQQAGAEKLNTTYPGYAAGIEKYLGAGTIRSVAPGLAAEMAPVSYDRTLDVFEPHLGDAVARGDLVEAFSIRSGFATQSAGGSRFVETLLSASGTRRQLGRDVFAWVTAPVQSRFAGQPCPSLLPEA